MHVLYDLSGLDKTALINVMAEHGAIDPRVRETAVGLVRGVPTGDHMARLDRLHRFVRDSIAYHREPIEMLHWPAFGLDWGGDCDDHAIVLPALAWALKYPYIIEPQGSPWNPSHYTVHLGYPESERPHGDEHTTWVAAETTIPARLGESVWHAVRRTDPQFRGDLPRA